MKKRAERRAGEYVSMQVRCACEVLACMSGIVFKILTNLHQHCYFVPTVELEMATLLIMDLLSLLPVPYHSGPEWVGCPGMAPLTHNTNAHQVQFP